MKKLLITLALLLTASCVYAKDKCVYKVMVNETPTVQRIYYSVDLYYGETYAEFKDKTTGKKVIIVNSPMIIEKDCGKK